ncbi:hypothetical protein ACIBKY_51010 [Nonomuraea sp. NPDC050394]|uniref:hypothetical protein n=1 Tax=Nonomuraea sp. NPDC050394 TaxID=3364363 RepID=UPI0037A78F59
MSYRVIAEELGYDSSGSAANDVKRALQVAAKADQLASEELLQLEIERLDRLLLAVWPKAVKSDLKAVERAESIIKQRCSLLGIDLLNRAGAESSDVISLLGVLFEQIQAANGKSALPAPTAGHADVEVEAVEVMP